MKMWVGLAVLMTLSFSSVAVLRGAEQEKSGPPGMSVTPDTQGKRVTGQLTHIEGWHYTIKDTRGEEVSFGVTSETDDPDKVKEGDHIVAVIREDRIALSKDSQRCSPELNGITPARHALRNSLAKGFFVSLITVGWRQML